MTPVRLNGEKTVIVQVDLDEKMHTKIKGKDGDVELFMYSTANEDGRLRQPTSGIAIGVPKDCEFPEGSYIIFHHNACASTQMLEEHGDIKIYRIQLNMIYAYRTGDGFLVPIHPYCMAKRIYEMPGDVAKETNSVVLPFSGKRQISNKAIIEKLPKTGDCYGLKVADKVLMFNKSDYECNYTQDGVMMKFIRINMESDILGILSHNSSMNLLPPKPTIY